MCNNAREYTCRLLEAMDAGLISAETIAVACLDYLSDTDVEDMIRSNDLQEVVEAV